MPTKLAEAARELAERGTPVFPLLPGEKKPLPGSHGYKDATTELDEVEEWWRVTPQANIGVPTGHEVGWFVLDVDHDPARGIDGPGSLRRLEAELGELPETVTVRTPGGGHHLRFLMPLWPLGSPLTEISRSELRKGLFFALSPPIRSAVEEGATRITVILPDPKPMIGRERYEEALKRRPIQRPRRTGLDRASTALDCALDKHFEAEVRGVQLVNHIIRQNPDRLPGYREIRVDVLTPEAELGETLDFERAHLDRLIRMGAVEGERWVLDQRGSEG